MIRIFQTIEIFQFNFLMTLDPLGLNLSTIWTLPTFSTDNKIKCQTYDLRQTAKKRLRDKRRRTHT